MAEEIAPDEWLRRGLVKREKVLGRDHVAKTAPRPGQFGLAWRQFATAAAWGGAWCRGSLDDRTRSVATLSVLVALGAEGELKTHFRGAQRNGLSEEDIEDLLIHLSVYAGFPRAEVATRVFMESLKPDSPE
jgi:alkylhydroperoxidase/carboxymuconolactone decarboxylase family protein YurZ